MSHPTILRICFFIWTSSNIEDLESDPLNSNYKVAKHIYHNGQIWITIGMVKESLGTALY